MKAIPQIQKYMTVLPKSIGEDQTLAQAKNFMSTLKLRHLPVLKAGKLVGILTERDINFILQFNDVDPEKVKVDEAYSSAPYATSPSTPLDEVVSHMADKKYGCALIVDNGKLVGIFTEVDAYRALSELLSTRLKH